MISYLFYFTKGSVLYFRQSGQPLKSTTPVKLLLEQQPQEPENPSGKVICDGRVIATGHRVSECLDLLFEFIWVFQLY